jgi:F-type H+-transporting ATPase subunit b
VSARLTAWLGLTIFFVARAALAAGAEDSGAHHDSGGGWVILIKHALNLGILAFILIRFAVPFLRDFMLQRSQDIRDQIEASQRALEDAQAEIASLRAELSRAADHEREIGDQAAAAAESERARALVRAEENALRLREDARRIADQEVERARGLLRAEAAQLATQLAAEMLRERLTAEDDRRLFDEFAQHVGGGDA